MYEHNGEKYFIVDGHVHFWNAAPDNWIEGQEQYAKAGSTASSPITDSDRPSRTGRMSGSSATTRSS